MAALCRVSRVVASSSFLLGSLVPALLAAQVAAPHVPAARAHAPHRPAAQTFPLVFEKNQGQFSEDLAFVGHTERYAVAIGSQTMQFALPGKHGPSRVVMSLHGSQATEPEGLAEAAFRTNYYIGSKPSEYRLGVRNYNRVGMNAVYPGIDVQFYATGNTIEHDFLVAPGADASQIVMDIAADGKAASLNAAGDLLVKGDEGELRLEKPVAYQLDANGKRHAVPAAFLLASNNGERELSFRLGDYDHSRQLVIDPTIQYATFIDNSSGSAAGSMVSDAAGNIYLAGTTNAAAASFSGSYPVAGKNNYVPVGVDPTSKTTPGAFLVRFNSSTAVSVPPTIAWLDYYSGTLDTLANAVAVQPGTLSTLVAIGGSTIASDLPNTPGTPSASQGPTRGFVATFSTAGLLAQAAYIDSNMAGSSSDSTIVNALAIDNSLVPNVYAAGTATGVALPVTASTALNVVGGLPGSARKGFVYELTPGLLGLGNGAFISYVNGSATVDTDLTALTVDGSGDIFVGGYTAGNFPLAGTYADGSQNTHNASETTATNDAFLAEITPGTPYKLLYSTWLSGSGNDELNSLALDTAGNLYGFGQTSSLDLFTGLDTSYTYSGTAAPVSMPTAGMAGSPVTGTFPTKTAPAAFAGFIVELNTTGQPQVGTYIGVAGKGDDVLTAGAVDSSGNVYAAGSSNSAAGMGYSTASTLSPTEDLTLTGTNNRRGVLLQLPSTLSSVNLVANLGGVIGPDTAVAIALDSFNHVYVAANITSTEAFTTANAFQPARTATQKTSAYIAQINPLGTGDSGLMLKANTCAADQLQPNQPVGCPDPLDFMSTTNASATYSFTLAPDSQSVPLLAVPVMVQISAPALAGVMNFSNCIITDTTTNTILNANACAGGSLAATIATYPSSAYTAGGTTDGSITLHTLSITFTGTLLSEPTSSTIQVVLGVTSNDLATPNTPLSATENSNIGAELAITGAVTSPSAGGTIFTTNISPASAPASTLVSYAFTITNNGGGAATGATFTLPSTSASGGFVIGTVSFTGGGSSASCNTSGCTGLTLNRGDTVVVTVTGTYLDSTLGTMAKVAAPSFPVSASATSGSGTDAITTNPNYLFAPGTAAAPFAGITLARGVHLTLATGTLTGQRSDGNYYLGDTITYAVPVTNAGPSTSNGTEPLKFTLPTGFMPNSTNCTASPCTVSVPAIGASSTSTVTITGTFPDNATNAGIGAGTTVTFSPTVALDTTYDVDSNPGVGTLTVSNTAKIERSAPLTISAPLIVAPATACAGGGSCLYMQNSGIKDSAAYTFTLNNAGPNISVNTVFTITLPSAPVNPAGTYHALVSTAPMSSYTGAAPFGTAITCVRNNTASNTAPTANTLTCSGNLPSGTFTVQGSLSADGNTVPLTVASVNTTAGTLGAMSVTQNAIAASLPTPQPLSQPLTSIEIDRVAHLVTTSASAATGTTPTTPINLDETATATAGVDDTVTVTINVGNTALNSASGSLTASLPQWFRITALPTVASTTAGTTVGACTLPAGYALNSTTNATPPSFTCPITVIAPGTATPSSGATAATNPAPQIKVTYSGKFLDNGTGVDITNVPAGSATKVASLTATLGTATATVQFAIDPYPGTTDASSAPNIAVQRLVHMYLAKYRNTSVAATPAGFADTTDPNLDEKKSGFGVNDEIEYDVAVANGGANKALGVQFSDTLPPYFTLVNTYLIQPGKTTNPDAGGPPAGQLTGALACFLGNTTTGTPLTTPFSTGAAGQMITCTYGTAAAPLALNTGAASGVTFHNASSIELVYQGKYQDNAPGVDNIPAGTSTYSVTSNANDASVTATLDVDNGTATDRSSTALATYKIQRATHLLLVTPSAPLTDLSGNALTKATDGTSIAAEGEPSTVTGSNPVVNCVRYKMYVQNVGPNVARSPMLSATLPGGMKLVGTPVTTATAPNTDNPQSDTCSYGGGASPSVSGSALVPTSESAGSSLVVDLDGYFDVNTLTGVNSLGGVALTYSALSDGTTAAPSSMDSGGTAFTATKGTALTVTNTPYGSNFSVVPFSGAATQPVALTFGSVATPGITTVGVASTTTFSLPKGQSPLPGASSTAINLYKSGSVPQFYTLGSTAGTITGNTGVCVANPTAGQALADGFAKPERVLLWDLQVIPTGTGTGTVPNVTGQGDITSSVLPLGSSAYVQAGGPLAPYNSTHTTLPAKQAQPQRVCGNLSGFAPATLAVLEPVNFTPVITANPSSPTQTPGKGVSEVTFLFPTEFDYNNADPCYVATTTGGAASRLTCDDNKVLTTRIYGGTSLVPSQSYEIGPMTPDVTTTFINTTFEVQAGQNLYDFVTDQLAEVSYLATNSCDPTGNPSSNPCPTTAASLTTNLQQTTLFGSGDIALLTPSVNGGSSALIIIPQGQTPSSPSTGVLGGAAQAMGTVNAGQTVGFLWRLRLDTGTTTGTYNLTCNMVDAATQTTVTAFPAGLTCQIPASVTLPTDIPVYIVTQGGGLYGSNSLGWKALGGTVFAGLMLPLLLFRRRLSYPKQIVLMAVLMLLGAAGLSGCGSGNNGTSGVSTTTVAPGTYWFRLTATPTAGGASTYSTAFSVKVVSGS